MNASTTPQHHIDAEALRAIRRALLIGLTCYGEIEERINAQEIYEVGGDKVPEFLRIIHPTGTSDVTSMFATALSYLDNAEVTA